MNTYLSSDSDAICMTILFLAILIFTKAKIRMSDLFMLGGLFYLMLSSRRQISMFTIAGSLILNRLLINLMEMYMEEKAKTLLPKKIGTILIIVIVLGLTYYFGKDKWKADYVDESTYPTKACNFILENIDIKTAKFYNEYNYGSYMLYRGIPVFIDSRADLYAPEFSGKEEDIFMDFIDTSNIGKFYGDIFEKYGMTPVITYKNSKVNMIITKTQPTKYKELYQDDYFVIYEIL